MNTRFLDDIRRNTKNAAILSRWSRLELPDAWLVAGCLFQTVWNIQQGTAPDSNIKDYDLFYFDGQDLNESSEKQAQEHVNGILNDLGVNVEVANQARVHVWYESHFGRPYAPLSSAEEGIRRFLVLETCVAVKPEAVFAPFGLEGVYAGTLSPNPLTPFPELFASKVASYQSRWPALRVQAAAHGA